MSGESGAKLKWDSTPRSRAETLRVKREITESRLAYARSVGDSRLIAMNEADLARIARWERGEE